MKAHSDELRIFVAVVESGSFSRAAQRLDMANSAVSRAVKKLEARLGVTLLARTTRQLSLTQEGEHYFRRVQHLLRELAAAENDLIASRQSPSGVLRVDAATPVILHLLMPMIHGFRSRYPQIQLSLISSENLINLIERNVDVAIRAGNLNDSTLRARPLFTSYRRIVASPDYLTRWGTPQVADDLATHACIGFVDAPGLNRWPLMRSGGEPVTITPASSSNSGETVKQLCLTGNGIACLSDYMIDAEIADGSLVALFSEQILPVKMPFNAVYYSDRSVSSRIRVFIDCLIEYVRTQPFYCQEASGIGIPGDKQKNTGQKKRP
ncbi:DNA-binding transcriptional regulator YafC [Pantoea sp. 1.19]|uniref:DNA-binding transcriptional regulator YafC n=1 Tax=Pantoea sp. 1.19 TaxID=1925589 RepID=UPI0009FB7EAC|nr:DNA-binding transcriptional regulator YafC [Pantoea sp. 1.19]